LVSERVVNQSTKNRLPRNWVAPTYRSEDSGWEICIVELETSSLASSRMAKRRLSFLRNAEGNVSSSPPPFSRLSLVASNMQTSLFWRAGGPGGKTNAGTKAVEAEPEKKESRRRRTRLSRLFSLVHKFPRAMNWATRILQRKLDLGK